MTYDLINQFPEVEKRRLLSLYQEESKRVTSIIDDLKKSLGELSTTKNIPYKKEVLSYLMQTTKPVTSAEITQEICSKYNEVCDDATKRKIFVNVSATLTQLVSAKTKVFSEGDKYIARERTSLSKEYLYSVANVETSTETTV